MLAHKTRLFVFPFIFLIVLALLTSACGAEEPTPTAIATSTPTPEAMVEKEGEVMAKDTMEKTDEAMAKESKMEKPLPDMIVAPHFVDSSPAHGDVLAKLPEEIVLNFNFNLNPNSSIALTRDGEPAAIGSVAISPNQLSMRAPITEISTDGVYQVSYTACWPDGSCHEGSIAFIVDATTIGEYKDLRGQSAVTIRMIDGLRFDPARIIISPNTTVTWINGDSTIHFVNTDPHPSHNVLEDLNSSSLNQGESYTYTFKASGAWGYHCSAHYNLEMVAQVIVQ